MFCGSLRGAETGLYELLAGVDALVVTVLAAGGAGRGRRSAAVTSRGTSARSLRWMCLCCKGFASRRSRAAWAESDAGLSPLDAAMQVAVPEFDGRLITVPFSFKEDGPDGVPVYVADAERSQRIAGLATAYARLRSVPNARQATGAGALVVPDQTLAGRQRGRAGHAGFGDRAAATRLRAAGYDLGPRRARPTATR